MCFVPRGAANIIAVLLALIVYGTPCQQHAHAQQRSAVELPVSQLQSQRQSLNGETLLMITGHPHQSYVRIALDISSILPADHGARLMPVMGKGGAENLSDLLLLQGMDLALVASNVLADADLNRGLGDLAKRQLAYVARLYGEEVHIIANNSIEAVENLRDKRIAVPSGDGNAHFTIKNVLDRLGIAAELVAVEPADAIDLIQSGEIAGLALVGGKPLPFVARLPKDRGLHLVPLSAVPALGDGYAPAVFGATDYPGLVRNGSGTEAIAVGAILMTKAKGRPQIDRFVQAFFNRVSDQAAARRHPKWTEVNLGATVPGWSRYRTAQQWLDDAKRQQSEWLQRHFAEFLSQSGRNEATMSAEDRRKLFDAFLKWSRGGSANPSVAADRQ